MTTQTGQTLPTVPPILVLGATGNVGGEIARQLLQAGVSFQVGVRQPGRVSFPDSVDVQRFDAADSSSYTVLSGIERLFLLWPPGTDMQRDVQPVIEAAAARGVQQVVFLSILGAEKIRVVPHRRAEQLLEASGMDWVFLRASYFMQNLSGVHRDDVRLRNEIFLPAGNGKTSFVDVRDVAAVAVHALLHGTRNVAYDLTGPQALDYDDVASIFSVTLGRRIRYTRPSALTFVRVSRQRGTSLSFALFMLAEYTAARLGLAGRVTQDIPELLGRPAIRLRRFAEDFRDAWL
ncbi:NAD(P)H-binding protein [Deinococcus ruber]|uniref:NAD(P)-dependent oxidoreductase n=1 Tax=Deinococcus ruber TaxID=1848197 RepID=A0A918FCH7_9DEIO|nr:NAD(P)H-binding protein [Deinococcus ruber]GGR22217.1 NAD(P)-dependent oxidoreductase [Deinococcus ruber]